MDGTREWIEHPPMIRRCLPLGLLLGSLACGGEDGPEGGGKVPTGGGEAQFDPDSCATTLDDGTRLWCFEGAQGAAGYRVRFAEVPALDDFQQPYLHRFFYLTYPDQVSECADARGFTPNMGVDFGLGGFECSASRVWDQHQAGYQTYDVAFCVTPDRSTAGWVIEPFQSPEFRVVGGPFERSCTPCEPTMSNFCEGAT